jgi:hypothetical protein
MRVVLGILVPIFFAATAVFAAAELRFESGEKQTALIELYTSEGCSSCPRAEIWLSRLKSDPGLWKEFIPLAFHVDYWDRLGWRDRFASRAWTERQYAYASLLRSSSLYTPEFILNGEEWRDWFRNRQLTKSEAKNAGVLSATTVDNKTFSISYRSEDHSNVEAHVALLGCGIASKISGGENNGRQLQHDFVVLDHQSQIMRNDSGTWRAGVMVDSSRNEVPQKAIAIWIRREKDLKSLQATGGWIGNIALTKQN